MTNQPKVDNSLRWEEPRICCTCLYFYRNTADPIQPAACSWSTHLYT